MTGLRPDALPALLEALVARGEAVRVGRVGWHVVHTAAFQRTRERVAGAVAKLHEKDKAMGSLTLAAVRAAAGRTDPAVLDAAVEALVAEGTLVRVEGGNVRHKGHVGAMSDKEAQRADRILALLERGGGQPPAPEDMEADLGVAAPEVTRLLRVLENRDSPSERARRGSMPAGSPTRSGASRTSRAPTGGSRRRTRGRSSTRRGSG